MSDSPWTRDNWNGIIRRVNELAANPPSGCDPIEPLPEVGPDHIWTKSDVGAVQDKLAAICKDNTFTSEELWKQSLISEIEEALSKGWCDCNDCLDMCPNAGSPEQIYLGSWGAARIHVGTAHYECSGHSDDIDDVLQKCRDVAAPSYTSADVTQYLGYLSEASRQTQEWIIAATRVCMYKGQIDQLRDMLAAAERRLADAQKSVSRYCVPDGDPVACSDARDEVQAASEAIKSIQSALVNTQQKLATEETKRDTASANADAAVQSSWALGETFGPNEPSLAVNLIQFYRTLQKPWGHLYTCDNPNDYPNRCRPYFSISQYDEFTGEWHNQATGSFTPSGLAYSEYTSETLPWCGVYTRYREGCPGWPPFYDPLPPSESEVFCHCSGVSCVGCSEGSVPPLELMIEVTYPEPVKPPCDGNEEGGATG
jgi:hypothetical protein